MNKIFFLIALILPVCLKAQIDTVIKYTEVVQVDSTTKEQLFQRARSWFNDAFKSSKDVIQIIDKETGEISGKGYIHSFIIAKAIVNTTVPVDYTFAVKLWVKDGKYKYEIGSFENVLFGDPNSQPFGMLTSTTTSPIKRAMVRQSRLDEFWKMVKDKALDHGLLLVSSLKSSMAKQPSNDF